MNPFIEPEALQPTLEFAEKTCCSCIKDVKTFCSGAVGSDMLLMLGFLVLLNYASLFFWKKLSAKEIVIGKFKVSWSIVTPAINFLMTGILLVYAWNAF